MLELPDPDSVKRGLGRVKQMLPLMSKPNEQMHAFTSALPATIDKRKLQMLPVLAMAWPGLSAQALHALFDVVSGM